MRKSLIRVALVAAGLAFIVVATASAKPHVIRAGNLFLEDNGGISPSKLPKHEQVPISAHIEGTIGTDDGSHPPAVRTLDIDFDRTIRVNVEGLPVCKKSQLTARSTAVAKRVCRDAIVGSGEAAVEVAFPEQAPFTAKGPLLLFNGGVHAGTTLFFAHAYVAVPAPTAVVAVVKLTHIHRGHYGTHTVTQVPVIAGGAGSAIGIKLRLGRRFTFRGRKESFLTASCPTGHYFTEGNLLFADGTTLQGTHILPCTPKG